MISLPWSLNADDLSNPERIWDDTHILRTLSILLYEVAGVSDRDFSSDLDEEDILECMSKIFPSTWCMREVLQPRSMIKNNLTSWKLDQ